jgi:hypothetical protein
MKKKKEQNRSKQLIKLAPTNTNSIRRRVKNKSKKYSVIMKKGKEQIKGIQCNNEQR